jgi:hypothetical protein
VGWWLGRAALLILALLAGGCSPTYVLRAGYEEAKILWRREPITTVLARTDLEPDVRRKLELVLDARRYAESIGLDVGGSFTSLSYVDGPTMLYGLTATPQTSLEPHVVVPDRRPGSVQGSSTAPCEAEAKSLVERGSTPAFAAPRRSARSAGSTIRCCGTSSRPTSRAREPRAARDLPQHLLRQGRHATAFNGRSRPSSATTPRSISSCPCGRDGADGGGARGVGGDGCSRPSCELEPASARSAPRRTPRRRSPPAGALLEPSAFPTLRPRQALRKFEDIRMNNAVLLQWLLCDGSRRVPSLAAGSAACGRPST